MPAVDNRLCQAFQLFCFRICAKVAGDSPAIYLSFVGLRLFVDTVKSRIADNRLMVDLQQEVGQWNVGRLDPYNGRWLY
jgi:hypothetical protein